MVDSVEWLQKYCRDYSRPVLIKLLTQTIVPLQAVIKQFGAGISIFLTIFGVYDENRLESLKLRIMTAFQNL